MKFICNQAEMNNASMIASRAVSTRSTMPILKGILIEANSDDTVTLTGSDGEISIETTIEASVLEPGSIVVLAKLFNEIMRKMPLDDLRFKEERDVAEIICGNTDFKIICFSSEEFPKITKLNKGEGIFINKRIFKNLIRKTSFAASIDTTRGILTGILINIEKDSLSMVALDGFRLALTREKIENLQNKRIIVPAKALDEIGRLMSEAIDNDDDAIDENVEIVLHENKVYFLFERNLVVTRLMEGSFINYTSIIPKEFHISVIVNKTLLKEAVERANILIKEGKRTFLKMMLDEDIMEISSRSDEGLVHEKVDIVKKGSGLSIGFNAKYLLDVLKVVSDEDIRMSFNNSTSPCLIRPMEGDEYIYMILPVRLASGS